MPFSTPRGRRSIAAAATIATAAMAPAALAQDVAIDDVLVTQAIRFFSTPLVGDNVTFIRVFVETPGTSSPVPDVDAIVRVFVDGVEADFSPLRSINGPIISPANPQDTDLNDHLNFWFVAPQSDDVDLRVVLNPTLRVPNDDLSNNIVEVNDLEFDCRGVEDLVYVPINYTPGGGLPSEELMEPGIGDGFVRGIFKAGAWNYHRSPLGPLLWTENVNDSNNALLNTLRDIRVSQLPSAGFPQPTFLYGWLPGNPFGGNGQAIGVPGDVAFGNTQGSRFQRTFAHEIGHLFGEFHNSEESNTLSIDVEHHLRDPLGVSQIRNDELDVMVAGQQTSVAWVSNNTFNNAVNDFRLFCSGLDAPDGPDVEGRAPMIRISGEVNHVAGTVRLDPATVFPGTLADAGRDDGTVEVVLRGIGGKELHRVRVAAGHTRACCADPDHVLPTSPLHVMVPAAPGGQFVARVEVVDAITGAELAAIDRSPSAPRIESFGPAGADLLGGGGPFRRGQVIDEPITLQWTVSDADGDATTAALFYSPDGVAWLPFRAGITGGAFDLDPDLMPRSEEGRLRLIVSDGLNVAMEETVPMSFLGGGSDPEVYIITPNQFQTIGFGGEFVLHGYAWDREDGTIADNVEWVSNIDGLIGVGRLFTVDDLSPGFHLLTAMIVDSDGNTSETNKTIQVAVRDLTTPDLDGDGTVGFQDLLDVLGAFGPCGDFCPADLNLDGTVDFNDALAVLAAWTA